MNNIIYNNAYGLLGLSPNASQKEVSKRVKEIEKMLQIDEIPEYDKDFAFYNKLRTKENIKQAFQDISCPQKQILHYFFSIYINSEQDFKILVKNDKNCDSEYLIKLYNNKEVKSLVFKKNIAILLTINLFQTKDIQSYLEQTTEIWKEIFDNNKTFSDFKKMYMLDDEIGIDEDSFNGLISKLKNELVNIFSDIADLHSDNTILANLISAFDLQNSNIDISQVDDIYKTIDLNINILKSMNISEDGIFDNEERATIKKCLMVFQEEFNKLIDLNLYNNERSIIIRDLVATTIRLQILDLFNNLDEDETAQKLMEFAIYIVGTDNLKQKLEDELLTIKKYSDEPIDEIKISKNKIVTLHNKYLLVNSTKVLYDDIQSLSYLLHTTRTNGIETERTYNFQIGTYTQTYDLTQYSRFFSNKSEMNLIFNKLVNLANYITPFIVGKLYKTILNGRTLQIGKLYINQYSYYIRKWNGDQIVRIKSQLRKPYISEGKVIILDDNGLHFTEISLDESNACLVPILITALINNQPLSDFPTSNIDEYNINPSYGLHIFYPEKETEKERKKVYRDSFIDDLISWIGIGIFICFIVGIIYSLFVR